MEISTCCEQLREQIYGFEPNIEQNQTAPFIVTKEELALLAEHRTYDALIELIETCLKKGYVYGNGESEEHDLEIPSEFRKVQGSIQDLVKCMRSKEEHDQQYSELAAAVVAFFFLRSSIERGIPAGDDVIEFRRDVFGSNLISDKKLSSFLVLCFEAVQDFVLIMLIVLGIMSIIIETTIGLEEGESCNHTCYIEGVAILTSVCIVVLVTAGIDYAKQFAFVRLTKSLDETNTKSVFRNGEQIKVTDGEIVVGDILSVNSHNLASIPADCILLGPVSGSAIQMDESPLTGESNLIEKNPGDIILSGTTLVEGSGKMVVIAVGINSVAGKIKARVYESAEKGDDELEGDEESPLFVKLTHIAKQIGWLGSAAATLAFVAMCIIGLGFGGESAQAVIEYFIVAITVLAVAVPEGLPLAVTLSLAFSSSKMMKENNLVKVLAACETMGCATTICTDKTGTLTANRMTARAIFIADTNFICDNPKQSLGEFVKNSVSAPSNTILTLIANLISVNTMNETLLYMSDDGVKVTGSSGNPTECALLHFTHDLGFRYSDIRNSTRGRADVGELAEFFGDGKQLEFSSARKMMGWAVPAEKGMRLYIKGAAEVILSRSNAYLNEDCSASVLTDLVRQNIVDTIENYAKRGMRCLALAYNDLPADVDFNERHATICNSDGTEALMVETGLVFCALVGIEDPLRPDVPGAIQQCYEAGIDVRMVTGDSPNTAVSIAYQAGILRDFHFRNTETIAENLNKNVLMVGKDFREKVYRVDENGKKEFDQGEFDKIWPYLRVLARSSPDDKLTLAHGLNQSTLFANKNFTEKILRDSNIRIFPDRQVVAMTGDGTNDAPALKRADIGFAMGISGTQIAKDAADIILLDDNFASIVTAAKWGRNVYASIQKFLQFQLTVNISAVITALVGAFTYQKSPLAAIQLLWVNLIMDALASLALASEPPVDELLKRQPVNRSQHMVTNHMLANMIGQASYQIIVIMILLFEGPKIFGVDPGHIVEKEGENSIHYTLIFNSFVWMQLFNEINCRKLKGEFFVFKGLFSNPLFCGILALTSVLQVVMVQFGSYGMHVVKGGLSLKYWLVSLAFGLGSLPMQQIINMWFRYGQKIKIWREHKRMMRSGQLTTRSINTGSG